MEEHPSPEKLRRFVAGELSQEDAREVMAHVLQGCRFCSEEAVRYNLLRLSRTPRPASSSGSLQSCRAMEEPSLASAGWVARSVPDRL